MSVATMSRYLERAYLRLCPEKTTKNRIQSAKSFFFFFAKTKMLDGEAI